jgi:hypothetical protein
MSIGQNRNWWDLYDMATLGGLDNGTRFRPNPDTYAGT